VALEQIVEAKRRSVATRKAERPLEGFRDSLGRSDRSLEQALAGDQLGFILECKKASPSEGLLRADFDAQAIAERYAPFASAISVITDEPFLQGSLEDLQRVRDVVEQPVLCKDFVVDVYQVYEARRLGADAILLMCSVLDDEQLRRCYAATEELGMDALVEVHDEHELGRALALGARIVGINNRNLATLEVDLATSEALAPKVPAEVMLVVESGIRDRNDVRRLREVADGFLIGSRLMRAADLDATVRELVFGRVKICGLTRVEQADWAHGAGASYGGLMLWPRSPRAVDLHTARAIREAAPLSWVGVFVDQPVSHIAEAARALSLDVVQLHGGESAATIDALRNHLPEDCRVWKAHRVRPGSEALPLLADTRADRLLVDAYRRGVPGGTGESFDWRRVENHAERDRLVLSGGLSVDNAWAADMFGCWALDLSSGVETAPGDKDEALMGAFFAELRAKRRSTDSSGADTTGEYPSGSVPP
jgi:indole-3-glycerol phosphate synthase/phosphoribosylanthranilate isomerase